MTVSNTDVQLFIFLMLHEHAKKTRKEASPMAVVMVVTRYCSPYIVDDLLQPGFGEAL